MPISNFVTGTYALRTQGGRFIHDIRWADAKGRSHRIRPNATATLRTKREREEEGRKLLDEKLAEARGERKVSKPFHLAAREYAIAVRLNPGIRQRLKRINDALATLGQDGICVDEFNQPVFNAVRGVLWPDDKLANGRPVKDSTIRSSLFSVVVAVLNYAMICEWLDRMPTLKMPPASKGKVINCTPAQAWKMLDACQDWQRPLLMWLFCVGSRLRETLLLDWSKVNLDDGTAVILAEHRKQGFEYIAHLPPALVAELRAYQQRTGRTTGRVFLSALGTPYADPVVGRTPGDLRARSGGQIDGWFHRVRDAAGLGKEFTPHACRHTWASWHYAVYKDPMKTCSTGGWATSQLGMVAHYAHKMPEAEVPAIKRFWGTDGAALRAVA